MKKMISIPLSVLFSLSAFAGRPSPQPQSDDDPGSCISQAIKAAEAISWINGLEVFEEESSAKVFKETVHTIRFHVQIVSKEEKETLSTNYYVDTDKGGGEGVCGVEAVTKTTDR